MTAEIVPFKKAKSQDEEISVLIDDIMLEVAFMFSQQGQKNLLEAITILEREGKIITADAIRQHVRSIQELLLKVRGRK